jgi:hypothetical protein
MVAVWDRENRNARTERAKPSRDEGLRVKSVRTV